jgi:hypothetical protein
MARRVVGLVVRLGVVRERLVRLAQRLLATVVAVVVATRLALVALVVLVERQVVVGLVGLVVSPLVVLAA